MPVKTMRSLAAELETRAGADHALVASVADAVRPVFPDATYGGASDITEDALGLVRSCVPGWTVLLHGKAMSPDGHWRCTLRESSTRDNDEYLGIGTGRSLALAVLGALVQLAVNRAGD